MTMGMGVAMAGEVIMAVVTGGRGGHNKCYIIT